MVAFNRFDIFSEDLAEKVHDCNADLWKVYLTNATPIAANTIKANIADISATGGYVAGGYDVQNATSRSGQTTNVTAVDVTITASGGSIGPFAHAVLYNDTPTSPADPLVGWWSYGSSITLLDGESFTVDFGSNILAIG